MKTLAFACALAALCAAPAFAQTPQPPASQPPTPQPKGEPLPKVSTLTADGEVILIPGRTLKVTLKDGKPTLSSEGVSEQALPPAPQPGGDQENWFPLDTKSVKIQPGVLALTMLRIPGKGTAVVAGNGLAEGVIFVTGLVRSVGDLQQISLTTTCAVGPGGPGVELWPEQIDAILVLEFLTVPGPTCADPASRSLYAPGEQPPSSRAPPAAAPPAAPPKS